MDQMQNNSAEFDLEEHEEETSYRSFNFAAEAAVSTSYDYNDMEDPVYRSVSLGGAVPMNSYYDPTPHPMQPGLPKFTRSADPMTFATGKMAPTVMVNQQSFLHVTKPNHLAEPAELCVLYQLEQTHLVLDKPLTEIVNVLSNTLEEIGALFIFKAAKHKFKCHLHSRSATIAFHVRLFKSSGQYIVEVQKRDGCSIQFCKVWHSLNNVLTSSFAIQPTPLDTLTPSEPELTSAPAQFGTPPAGHVRSAISPLLEMVRSGKIDLQRNALVSLDMLSTNSFNATAILAEDQSDAVRFLCEAVELADKECCTRALSTIANLLSASVHVQQVLSAHTEQQMVAVIAPITQILRQDTSIAFLNMHVQAVRTLSCISAAVQASRSILAQAKFSALLACKVQQCSNLAYTARPVMCLTQMQQQVAVNVAMCT